MKISVEKWREDNGYVDEGDFDGLLEEASFNGVCPAACSEGCEVEPDGECPHGAQSLLLAMRMI